MKLARIQFINVEKVFPTRNGRVKVLHDVAFQVDPQEFVVILGPSGCGKTTLLKITAGLYEATSGRVLVDGIPVHTPSPDRGLVFQNFSLFPWSTVRQNIAFGPSLHGTNRKALREKVDHYLRAFGLAEFEAFYPSQISGGMQQRVALARTLVNNPRILLLDEPFGSLDAYTRNLIQDFFNSIISDLDKTVLLVTHDINEAVYLADRVIVLSPRPAHVIAEVAVDIARPRTRAQTYEPHFQELARKIYQIVTHG